MKIFIIGGSGRVGTELIKYLSQSTENEIVASSRHPQNIIKKSNVIPVKLNLHDDLKTLAKTIGYPDVIYYTAGSNGSDLLQVDLMGAVKTMKVAEQHHVKRYIMLSAMFPLQPEKWRENGLMKYADYKTAKYFADDYLVHRTKLQYTILSPTNLTEEKGTGKITIDEGKIGTNPIPDVALTLAKLLDHPNTINKVIMMRTGNTSIDQELTQVK